MKKISNIFNQIVCFSNLYKAAYKTLLHGRRYRGEGANFKFNLEPNLIKLEKELVNHTYKHGKYHRFKIYDPKERLVLAAPVRDRVVHHAVHDVIEPLFDPMFIYDTYACRKGKGTHKAIRRAQCFLNACDYALHLDVRQYFPSIHTGILKHLIERKINDSEVLWLLDLIINSTREDSITTNSKSDMNQLDLFGPEVSCDNFLGLPIGNLTSQFFANLYLNELDQFAKHTLKVKYYIRYMDDMVFFSSSKQELKSVEQAVRQFCKEKLALDIKDTAGPVFHKSGLTFLGFRIFRHHLRLKSQNIQRFYRHQKVKIKMVHEGLMTVQEMAPPVKSWMTFASFGDTWRLRESMLKDLRKRVLMTSTN